MCFFFPDSGDRGSTSSPQYDALPPSPLLQTSDTEGKLNEEEEEEEASPALLEEEVPGHQMVICS